MNNSPLRHGAMRAARVGVASTLTVAALVGGTQVVAGSMAVARTTTMTTTATVNVRTGPSTSSRVLDVAPAGSSVVATGRSTSGWTPVLWRGRAAFISSAFLTTSRAPMAAARSTGGRSSGVTTVALNVRTGPSTSTSVVRVLRPGTRVSLTGTTSDGWLQVVVDGRTLWVSGRYVRGMNGSTAPTPPGGLPPVVGRARATTTLMVRSRPGPVFDTLGDIPSGTVLDLTGRVSGGTSQVIWEGALRWVNNRFLVSVNGSAPGVLPAPLPAVTGYRYAVTALNIRSSPTGDATLYEVPAGTRLAITGRYADGRAQVVVQGAVRWVTAAYISTTPPSGIAPHRSPISRTVLGGRPELGTGVGGSTGLDGLVANAQQVVLASRGAFPVIRTIYGVRADPLPDHPSGHAVDLMLPNYRANERLGWQVAHYMQAHASELGVKYVIFHQQIWSVARAGEGWRPMADRGGDTVNHFDHVHVTVY